MGLIYSTADSERLIDGLNTNIAIAQRAVDELIRASQTLTNEIGAGKALDGIAFRAGSDLFTDLIIPTVHRADSVFSQMREHLTQYTYANEAIAGEGYLNEDLLNFKLWGLRALKAATDVLVDEFMWLAEASRLVAPLLADQLSDGARWLAQFSEALQQGIDAINEKLNLLHQFEMAVATIFNDDLTELKLVVQSVGVLNETRVHGDGTYTLPDGIDKSWFSELYVQDEADPFDTMYEGLVHLLSLEDDALHALNLTQEQSDWYKRAKMLLKNNPAKLYDILNKDATFWAMATKISARFPSVADKFLDGVVALEQLGASPAGAFVETAMRRAADSARKYKIYQGSRDGRQDR
jgi:hypothetical protein